MILAWASPLNLCIHVRVGMDDVYSEGHTSSDFG